MLSLKWVCSSVPTYSQTLDRDADRQMLGRVAQQASSVNPTVRERNPTQLCRPPVPNFLSSLVRATSSSPPSLSILFFFFELD